METKNNLKRKSSNNSDKKTLKNYFEEFDALEKRLREIRQHELDFVFNPMSQVCNNLSLAREHTYDYKIKDLDIYITISLNLVSFSLALLIAFVAIPQLGTNLALVMVPLVLSTFILIYLIFYRRKLAAKLTHTYLEGLKSDALMFSKRAERHLNYCEEDNNSAHKRLEGLRKELKFKGKKKQK